MADEPPGDPHDPTTAPTPAADRSPAAPLPDGSALAAADERAGWLGPPDAMPPWIPRAMVWFFGGVVALRRRARGCSGACATCSSPC